MDANGPDIEPPAKRAKVQLRKDAKPPQPPPALWLAHAGESRVQCRSIGKGAYGSVFATVGQVVKVYKVAERDAEEHLQEEKRALDEMWESGCCDVPRAGALLRDVAVHPSAPSPRLALTLESFHSDLSAFCLRQRGPVPLRACAIVCRDVLRALRCAHKVCHRVHRDVKPNNILVELGDNKASLKRVVLADWGASAPIDQMCAEWEYVVTRWWRPASIMLGHRFTPSDDLWSLGAILYELLTGMGFNANDNPGCVKKMLDLLGGDETMADEPVDDYVWKSMSPDDQRCAHDVRVLLRSRPSRTEDEVCAAIVEQAARVRPKDPVHVVEALARGTARMLRHRPSERCQHVDEADDAPAPKRCCAGLPCL